MDENTEIKLNKKLLNHIQLKLNASLIMLFSNMRELKTLENSFGPYEKLDEIKEIENQLLDCALNIEKTLTLPSEKRFEERDKLMLMKQQVFSIGRTYFAYLHSLNILFEKVNDICKLNSFDKQELERVDLQPLLEDLISFIEDNGNNLLKINVLMQHLPLQMTKEKYLDYIKDSLRILFADETKASILNSLNIIKLMFLPIGLECYGKYTPQIKEFLDNLFKLQFEKMAEEELVKISDSIEYACDSLENIIDYLRIIHESINCAILVTVFEKELSYLLEDVVQKDLFYYAKNALENGEDENLTESANEMFENILSDIVDKILEDENAGLLDKDQKTLSKYSESLKSIYDINQYITDIYYELFEENIMQIKGDFETVGEDLADDAFIAEILDDFTEYITNMLKGIDPKLARYIKSQFFSKIPLSYNLDEVILYTENAIRNISDPRKKLLMREKINSVFRIGSSKEYSELI